MKKSIYFLLLFLLYINPQKQVFAISDPLSVPNNKFGIHILYPEEISLASKMINTNGGDWGYVTIPIQSVDKNLEKWQKFMDDAKILHIIPIIRLATYPQGENWVKPDLYDAVDFANFLNSLSWPTKNRYVIIFNEVNRAQEWGGELNPAEYANYLNDTIDIFKSRSDEFFILNAGFDAAAPNNHVLMDEFTFLGKMEDAVPGILKKIDGWNSHSYPNPDFSARPWENRRNTIYGYQWEQNYLSYYFDVQDKPVFITETGWKNEGNKDEMIADFYSAAFRDAWSDSQIVAVTPFLLTAGDGPFKIFSFTKGGGEPMSQYKKISALSKITGNPLLTVLQPTPTTMISNIPSLNPNRGKKLPAGIKIPSLWKDFLKIIFFQ